jgi:hypothetical protein
MTCFYSRWRLFGGATFTNVTFWPVDRPKTGRGRQVPAKKFTNHKYCINPIPKGQYQIFRKSEKQNLITTVTKPDVENAIKDGGSIYTNFSKIAITVANTEWFWWNHKAESRLMTSFPIENMQNRWLQLKSKMAAAVYALSRWILTDLDQIQNLTQETPVLIEETRSRGLSNFQEGHHSHLEINWKRHV